MDKSYKPNDVDKIDSKVFKICYEKCCKMDHVNIAGETIHPTVYKCMDHCGNKWQSIRSVINF